MIIYNLATPTAVGAVPPLPATPAADPLAPHRRLGARLWAARAGAGWSQQDAALAVGVSVQQYRAYEGGRSRISAVALFQLATIWKTDLAWFHAPDAPGAEAAPAPRPGEAVPAGTRHILLVDDDPDVLRVTGATLRRAGFAVTIASSGDDALRTLARGLPFDALITDYAMPGLSGVALTELALERNPALPAMVVTGYGRDSELRALPKRVRVLAKPFTRTEFVGCVEALLGGAALDADRTEKE